MSTCTVDLLSSWPCPLPTPALKVYCSTLCLSYQQGTLSGGFVLLQIAMKELRDKKIPFIIRRYLPDGRYVFSLQKPSQISDGYIGSQDRLVCPLLGCCIQTRIWTLVVVEHVWIRIWFFRGSTVWAQWTSQSFRLCSWMCQQLLDLLGVPAIHNTSPSLCVLWLDFCFTPKHCISCR